MPSYVWDTNTSRYRNLQGGFYPTDPGGGGEDPEVLDHEWSDDNLPWAYTDTSVFTEGWPSDVHIVDIQTGSSDFFTNLTNTVNAAGQRCVVRLGEGVYGLNSFRMYGQSGNPLYSFGFFFPNLQGFLGQGPDKTFVQMNANSMTQTQLDLMAEMDPSEFRPLGMNICRFDGANPASPVLLAGLTFRSADQQNITARHPNFDTHASPMVVPQPAPHGGVTLYQNAHARVQYVRFQAAGRACSSAPPFECPNLGSQYGNIYIRRCEFDGRRSPDLDPARPRRCLPIMPNNETSHVMEDCWLHHSNISRYAANDENRDTQGQYVLTRCKIERISDGRNTDPALNGGQSLGGYSDPSALGWESCNGTITLNDCIVSQDNNQFMWQSTVPQHLQLTSVGPRDPQGGRFYVNGGEFRDTGWPQLSGFLRFRVSQNTYWYRDGYNTTLHVYHKDGHRLQPYQVTGNWPPSVATLTANGITPQTHFLVRS